MPVLKSAWQSVEGIASNAVSRIIVTVVLNAAGTLGVLLAVLSVVSTQSNATAEAQNERIGDAVRRLESIESKTDRNWEMIVEVRAAVQVVQQDVLNRLGIIEDKIDPASQRIEEPSAPVEQRTMMVDLNEESGLVPNRPPRLELGEPFDSMQVSGLVRRLVPPPMSPTDSAPTDGVADADNGRSDIEIAAITTIQSEIAESAINSERGMPVQGRRIPFSLVSNSIWQRMRLSQEGTETPSQQKESFDKRVSLAKLEFLKQFARDGRPILVGMESLTVRRIETGSKGQASEVPDDLN